MIRPFGICFVIILIFKFIMMIRQFRSFLMIKANQGKIELIYCLQI